MASAITGNDGSYTIIGLPTGSYTVEFTNCENSGDFANQWYDNQATESTADPVAVTAGSTVASVNAALQPGGSITGK